MKIDECLMARVQCKSTGANIHTIAHWLCLYKFNGSLLDYKNKIKEEDFRYHMYLFDSAQKFLITYDITLDLNKSILAAKEVKKN